MTRAINFLPWRATRRRQQRRIGLLYAVGFLLALSTIALANRATRHADEVLAAARSAGESQLYSALRQRESVMREQQQQLEQRRLRQQKRALTAAWQPRLRIIATRLPDHAWLTRLEYQHNALTLQGLALNLQALASLERGLSQVMGFRPATAGETRRDAQGRWQFSFSLAGDGADEGIH